MGIARAAVAALIFTLGCVCGNCWGSIGRAAESSAEILPEPIELSTAPPIVYVPVEVAPEPVAPVDPPTAEELEAALVLARYGANEAGFAARADALMIWQTAEGHAETLEGQVAWLRRHSRCVVARRAPEEWPPGNCRWARFLSPTMEAPTNWPARWEWSRSEPEWAAAFGFALRVVRGEVTERPCVEAPDTWDGRRWLEDRLEHGYRVVSCSDPWTGEPLLNVAYKFPDRRTQRNLARARAESAPVAL